MISKSKAELETFVKSLDRESFQFLVMVLLKEQDERAKQINKIGDYRLSPDAAAAYLAGNTVLCVRNIRRTYPSLSLKDSMLVFREHGKRLAKFVKKLVEQKGEVRPEDLEGVIYFFGPEAKVALRYRLSNSQTRRDIFVKAQDADKFVEDYMNTTGVIPDKAFLTNNLFQLVTDITRMLVEISPPQSTV